MREISKLHAQFFDDPSPTDCISFPIDGSLLGDIFVSPQAAIDYVQKKGGNVQSELLLYVIHGLLHLMGYDDMEKNEKRRMRRAEKRHLLNLQKLGLL